MFTAILAAIFGAGGDITNKHLLGRLKLPHKEYLPFIFAFLTIVSLLVVRINFFFSPQALSFWNIILLIIMIAVAAVWNVMTAKSLETEPLHEYESIILMLPLVTVILAAIFLPTERNIHIFIAAIIASGALMFVRYRREHFEVTKTARQTFFAVVLIAIESVIITHLLRYYSPALLYLIRVSVITIIYFIKFKPDFRALQAKPIVKGLALDAVFGTGVMVLKYYAFRSLGLMETTIILLLTPLLTYTASYYYFVERRLFKRDLICAVVVVGCIIYALASK